jgi:hypothetical protein
VKLKEEETMDRKSWPIRLMAVLLVVPAFACADNQEAEVEIEAEPEPPPPALAPVTVQLMPLGGSALTGEVVATRSPEDVNVRVSVAGLTEGEDYEAKLKYGMCSDAQAHFDGRDATPGTEPAAGAMDAHDPGEEFAEIELTVTGMTGTGSADIDADELRENEPAYVAIEIDDDLGDDDKLLGCADLTGRGGINMDTGTGTGTTPGATTPGTTPTDTTTR